LANKLFKATSLLCVDIQKGEVEFIMRTCVLYKVTIGPWLIIHHVINNSEELGSRFLGI